MGPSWDRPHPSGSTLPAVAAPASRIAGAGTRAAPPFTLAQMQMNIIFFLRLGETRLVSAFMAWSKLTRAIASADAIIAFLSCSEDGATGGGGGNGGGGTGGMTYALIPTTDFGSSVIYELNADASDAMQLFEYQGFTLRVFRVR